MSDDNNSDHEAVRDHALNFIKTGVRSSADELSGAALGFARGGPIGALAMGFAMPIVEGDLSSSLFSRPIAWATR